MILKMQNIKNILKERVLKKRVPKERVLKKILKKRVLKERVPKERVLKERVLKKILKKILKERLILNHIIILNNVFGNEACSRILFYKVCPHLHPYLRSFLDYLQILPRRIPEVDLNKTPSDHRITTILNELK